MGKSKWIIGGTVSVFLCGTVVAFGQHHVGGRSVVRNITPLTPAQRTNNTEIWRLDQAAAEAMDIGQYAEAETAARQSISLGAASGKGQELLASALNAQGKTQEALQVYKVMADEGDVFPRNEVPYALLLLRTGRWFQAVIAYNKMLPYLPEGATVQANSHFSPKVPQPKELAVALHIAQGLTYIGDAGWGSRSRHGEAMDEFEQALQLAPDLPLANYYYGYGWQHLDLKSPTRAANAQRAKAAFQKAAALGGGDVKKAAGEELRGFK